MKLFKFILFLLIVIVIILAIVKRHELINYLERITHGESSKTVQIESKETIKIEESSTTVATEDAKTGAANVKDSVDTDAGEEKANQDAPKDNDVAVESAVKESDPVNTAVKTDNTRNDAQGQEVSGQGASEATQNYYPFQGENTGNADQGEEAKVKVEGQATPPTEPLDAGQVTGTDDDSKWLHDQARQAVSDGEYQTALKAYQELIDKDQQQPDVWGELGDVFHRMGENRRAAMAYANAAILYNSQGRADRVRKIIPYLERHAPDLIDRMGID